MTAEYDIGRAKREALFFDSMATNGHEREDVRHGSYETITEAAIRRFSDALAGSRLHLEVGAGTQPFSALLPVASQAVCVDVSFESLRLAKRRSPQLDYVCCDAGHLPFLDAAFDGVIGSAILHHLQPASCAPEILRVRKPGAVAAFSEPQAGNVAIWLFRRLHKESYSPDERPLSASDLRAWAGDGNSQAQWLELVGIVCSVAPPVRKHRWVLAAFRSIDAFIARRFPPLRPLFRYVIIEHRKPNAA